MAHNTLSEKLDHIQSEELGFPFDEEALWVNLESKLDSKVAFNRRWMIAASIFLLVFLAPLTLLKEWNADAPSEMVVEEVVTIPEKVEMKAEESVVSNENIQRKHPAMPTLTRIGVKPVIASVRNDKLVALEPIHFQKEQQPLQQFAVEDISIIQASLEKSKVEKGRSVSIRAQWQTPSRESNVKYQALKIKLNEKEN